MATTNIMRDGTHTQNMKDCHAPRFGWVSLNNSPFHSMQSTFSSPSQQLLGILLFLLPFIRNLPSIRHPNSCIIVWKPLICWLVFLPSLSLLPTGCPWFTSTEVLSIRKGRNRHTNLCIMWGVFVDDDGHKNGPTPRHVVGTEMQRDYNFKTHVSHFSYCLDCMSTR